MRTTPIVTGLILLFAGVTGEVPWLVGLGVTSVVAGMARAGGAPRWAAWTLWGWLTAVIWLLPGVFPLGFGPEGPQPGQPVDGAGLMLVGIWLVPVFIAPLAFLIHFRSWLSE